MQEVESLRRDDTSGTSRHLRAAVEAATALYHFREHLPPAHQKTRNVVSLSCPDYDFLGDVVNASKHAVINQGKSPLVKSAADLQERKIVTMYRDDDGDYSDHETIVIATCTDGMERTVGDALINVFNYWGQELKQMGVLHDFVARPIPPPPGSQFVPRSEAQAAANLRIIQGVRFALTLQVLQWDPMTQRSKPIDLTGCQASLRIYQPAYILDVTLTPPNGGEPIQFALELTESEAQAVHCAPTDHARIEVQRRIIESRQHEFQTLVLNAIRSRQTGKEPPES